MLTNLIKSSILLPIVAVMFSALPARADMRNFTMMNDSSDAIASLHVSTVSSDSWEEDILGVDLMSADTSLSITFDSNVAGRCMYDVKVVPLMGEPIVASGVNLCETSKMIYDGEQLVSR